MVDLQARCDHALHEALSLVKSVHDDNDWIIYKEDSGCVFSSHPSTTNIDMVRGQVTISKSISEVFRFITNPFRRREVDSDLSILELIDSFPGIRCLFYQNKLDWPLDSIERVYAEGDFEDNDGTKYVLGRSINAEEVGVDKGFVREEVRLMGGVMRRVREGFTLFTWYFWAEEIKGLGLREGNKRNRQQVEILKRIKQRIEQGSV
jgi:hypothetical protein